MTRLELPLGALTGLVPVGLAASWIVAANGRLAEAEAGCVGRRTSIGTQPGLFGKSSA